MQDVLESFFMLLKCILSLGPPENVGFTWIDQRIGPDHWARTRALVRVDGSITWVRGLVHTHSNLTVCFAKETFESAFNVSACTCGGFFAYLSAHARVMITRAFHQIGPVHLANRL